MEWTRIGKILLPAEVTVRTWFEVTRDDPCPWCGCRMVISVWDSGQKTPPDAATRDHIQPRSRGGPDAWDNVTAVCAACNQAKGDRTVLEHLVARQRVALPLRLLEAAQATFGIGLWSRTPGGVKRRHALLCAARDAGVLGDLLRLPEMARYAQTARSQLDKKPQPDPRMAAAIAYRLHPRKGWVRPR